MGGSGSGNWYRGGKGKVEDYRKLSISRMCKLGSIQDNSISSGIWQWTSDGEVTSAIGYKSDTYNHMPHLQLKYQNSNTKEEFDYKIMLQATTPNYGGKRWWFVCPLQGCGRRVTNLYGSGRYYGCRHCYHLAYQSQNDPPHYRALHKAQKIHQELGGSGCTHDYLEKPKHMHWKTFNRKIDEMNYLDDIAMMHAMRRFGLVF